MLYFRNKTWLLDAGESMFSAYITPVTKSHPIMWELSLKYFMGGCAWRRVPIQDRPMFDIGLSSIRHNLKPWTAIEKLNYWGRQPPGLLDPDNDWWSIDATFWPKMGVDAMEHTGFADAMWRVTGREGAFFTVEISGLADGRDRIMEALEKMIGVTPDGREERVEPPRDFWIKNSVFYAIETIPFGNISVRVPRNARDPQSYAIATARNMTGAPEPEHVSVFDSHPRADDTSGAADDIYVTLHFHGRRGMT